MSDVNLQKKLDLEFIVLPAIDLRGGQVVRLKEGNPERQTRYPVQPADAARRWLECGARWLHVVNLDGAFGENSHENWLALENILRMAGEYGAAIQFGGGLRRVEDITRAFACGVRRVVLGTMAIEDQAALQEAIICWGAERIAVSLDARGEKVQVRGWKQPTSVKIFDLALQLKGIGLQWLIYTDTQRDGLKTGINLEMSACLARHSGLRIIASGGARSLDDITGACENQLAGIILGSALYEGIIDLVSAIRICKE